MARFRIAKVNFAGEKILHIVAGDDMLRGNKMEELFKKYQTDDQIVFVEVEHRGANFHHGNGDLFERFYRDVDTSQLRYGPIESI